MDDSFRVRVEKVFGSLSSSSTATSTSNLWSLSDEEIERRKLNREDRRDSPSDHDDEPPQPNSPLVVKQPIRNDIDAGNPVRSEDWEIRSSIGLDCTLDYEEEEDEFDKLAVGCEDVDGPRFYERDIDDYGIDYHEPNLISGSFNGVVDRDPRANRMAANLKLIEDSEAAGDFHSSAHLNATAAAAASVSTKQHVEDKINPKPILKKREKTVETRSHKRVRFSNISPPGAHNSPSEGCSEEATSLLVDESPQEPSLLEEKKPDEPTALQTEFSNQVPDYIRNPSRYTHYTLDSADEVDEASNKKAYTELSKSIGKPKADELQPDDFDPSFPVIFTLKKKMDDNTSPLKMDTVSDPTHGEGLKDTANPVVIAAANTDDDGVCAMDEDLQDDVPNHSGGSNKARRQYRARANVIHDDCVG